MGAPDPIVATGNSEPARYAILVDYDGTAYQGWQRQEHGPSVQGAIEQAISGLAGRLAQSRETGDEQAAPPDAGAETLRKGPLPPGDSQDAGPPGPSQVLRLDGAGRTDTGVHATGQVAAFTFPHILPERAIVHALNIALPPDIRILAARRVAAGFDPRRDAIRRRYVYTLAQGGSAPALGRAQTAWIPARLDWERVRAALAACEGHHDFTAFRGPFCTSPRTELTLERARLLALDPRGPAPEAGSLARFEFVSRSFLHNMVRLLVGAAMECGRGRLTPERIAEMLASGSRGATQIPPAPPEGLALAEVEYPFPLWR